MQVDEKGLRAAIDVLWPAQEWNGEERVCEAVARAAITAYEAAKPVAAAGEMVDSRLDMAWADGARSVMIALDHHLPDSPEVREMEQRIAQRQADAIGGRKLSRLASLESARSAEPVAWRLLRNGEVIEAADQVLADDTVTWLPLRGWEIGRPYYPGLFVPVRRAHPTPEGSDV